jgi:alanine racemase
VLLLGGCATEQLDEAIAHDLTPAIVSREGFEALLARARERGRPLRCHLKVDTGMSRLGIPWDQLGSVVRELSAGAPLEVEGVLTHLACSDDPAVPFTRTQLDRFRRTRAQVAEAIGRRPLVHVASSAGLLTRAEADVELVRPGVALYGLNPFGNEPAPELTPALTLATRVVRVVDVPAGTPVGYGGTFITRRASRLATLPVGYDDGLRRALGDDWEVAIAGERAPLVGRVSMDLCVADVTDLARVAVGDEVVVVGGVAAGAHPVEEMARRLETIPYEVTCGIGSRVPRVHLAGGVVVSVRSRFGVEEASP